MKTPVVGIGHPDHYRFDNPSSTWDNVAAGGEYPRFRKNDIERHLRLPRRFFSNIHDIINARAMIQYADRSSDAHKERRTINAYRRYFAENPLTPEQKEDAYWEMRGRQEAEKERQRQEERGEAPTWGLRYWKRPQTRNFYQPRPVTKFPDDDDSRALAEKRRQEHELNPEYGILSRMAAERERRKS